MTESGTETIGNDGIVRTFRRLPSDPITLADGPGTWVETLIDADISTVWSTVTDINAPSAFSTEFLGASWVSGGPALGSVFRGRNRHDAIGEWEVDLFVNRFEHNQVFGWATSDSNNPGASWWFTLTPTDKAHTREADKARTGEGVVLRFEMTIGPGPSGLTAAIASLPVEMEPRVIHRRIGEHHANMTRTLQGIKQLAEST